MSRFTGSLRPYLKVFTGIKKKNKPKIFFIVGENLSFGLFFQNRMELLYKKFLLTGIAHFRVIARGQSIYTNNPHCMAGILILIWPFSQAFSAFKMTFEIFNFYLENSGVITSFLTHNLIDPL